MISLAFTKLEHRFIRQIRFRHIISGGHDNTPFEAVDARRPDLSHPPDASTPFEAPVEPGGFDWRARGPRRHCCRARRFRLGGVRAEKRCAPPARQRTTPPLALLLFALLSFLFSAQLQL
jgi:hypothetical protein